MLINLKNTQQTTSFINAVKTGLSTDGGLYCPSYIQPIDHIQTLLDMDFISRSQMILAHLIGQEIDRNMLDEMVAEAFNFPIQLESVSQNIFCLELFHGPTLAFKDFGARFMAQCLQKFSHDTPITILTATSGDTGAAVAHAFLGMMNVDVRILYPKGKISELQEKLFCTLGKNIKTYAIDGDFDDCQAIVKAAFQDQRVNEKLNLNSANSINIARLFSQVCYYFEACANLQHNNIVVSVPSGNFGNLTAGLIAKQMGAPIKRFIAATNINDTVPRFIKQGLWQPNPTQMTASNAMDVSIPNNWPRIMHLLNYDQSLLQQTISPSSQNDSETYAAMRQLQHSQYISEPHSAVAYAGLKQQLAADEVGIFLGTAHPAKFKHTVDDVLHVSTDLPLALESVKNKAILSIEMTKDTGAFIECLLN